MQSFSTGYVQPCIESMVIIVKEHSNKKPLEGYGKDSDCLHRWFPIEFITEITLSCRMTNYHWNISIIFDCSSILFSKCNDKKFVYRSVILYEANGLRCYIIHSLDDSDLSSRYQILIQSVNIVRCVFISL